MIKIENYDPITQKEYWYYLGKIEVLVVDEIFPSEEHKIYYFKKRGGNIFK